MKIMVKSLYTKPKAVVERIVLGLLKSKNPLDDEWNFIGGSFFPTGSYSIEIATQKKNTNPAISLGSLSP